MKKSPINITKITSKRLRSGDYKDVLPEYYALKSVSETNPWHLDQNVFDHAVAVFDGLENVLKLGFLPTGNKRAVASYLEKSVGKHSRRELLTVATILHDIAKSYLHIQLPGGKTACPGHEMIGASTVKRFSDRFGLNSESEKHVKKLVHFHGFVNDVLTLLINNKNLEKMMSLYEDVVGDIQIELLLFMFADMKGSDFEQVDPMELNLRIDAIRNALIYLT